MQLYSEEHRKSTSFLENTCHALSSVGEMVLKSKSICFVRGFLCLRTIITFFRWKLVECALFITEISLICIHLHYNNCMFAHILSEMFVDLILMLNILLLLFLLVSLAFTVIRICCSSILFSIHVQLLK